MLNSFMLYLEAGAILNFAGMNH